MQRTVDRGDSLSGGSGLLIFLATGSGSRTIRSEKLGKEKGKGGTGKSLWGCGLWI